jgi:hypothetical protein
VGQERGKCWCLVLSTERHKSAGGSQKKEVLAYW